MGGRNPRRESVCCKRSYQFIMMWPCDCVSCLCWRAGGIVAGRSLTVYSMCYSGTGLHCVQNSLRVRLHKPVTAQNEVYKYVPLAVLEQGTAVLNLLGTRSVLNIRTTV
jgi:hypothetical protein